MEAAMNSANIDAIIAIDRRISLNISKDDHENPFDFFFGFYRMTTNRDRERSE